MPKTCLPGRAALLAAAWLFVAVSVFAAPPQKVLYQGTLRRSGSVYTGNATFVFRLTDSSGGTQYWTSGSTVVPVSMGLFRYPIGTDNAGGTGLSGKPLSGVDWPNITPYIEVTVDGTVLTPREAMASVPYALSNDDSKVLKTGDAMTGPLTLSGSTLTISGNAFSVGGSSFTVLGGSAAVAYQLTAGSIISGASITASAFFGYGGNLTGLPSSETNTYVSSKTFAGSVLSGGSVTASAFFGYGGNLTGISASETNTFASSKTFAGDVLAGGSVTASAFFGYGGNLTGIAAGEANTYASSKTFTADAFSVGGSTLVVAGGNVGIGTTNPGSKLVVQGIMTSSSNVDWGAGLNINTGLGNGNMFLGFNDSAANVAPLQIFASSSNGAQFWSYGNGTLFLGQNRVGVNWGGKPTSSDAALSVRTSAGAPSLRVKNGSGDDALAVQNNGDISIGSGTFVSTFAAVPGNAAYALQLSSGVFIASGPIAFGSSGFIRFGDNTIQTTAAGTPGTFVQKTGDAMTGPLTMLSGSTITVGGSAFSVGGSTLVVAGGNIGIGTTAPGAKLDIEDANAADSYSLRVGTGATAYHLVVSTMGSVGVGTTSPANGVDVVGRSVNSGLVKATNANGTGSAGFSSALYGTPSGIAAGLFLRTARGTLEIPTGVLDGDQIGLVNARGYDGTAFASSGRVSMTYRAIGNWSTSNHGTAIDFATTSSGTLTTSTKLRISDSGNVGIGTTSPATTLEVNGTAQFGSGATKSTFTTTGALTLASNAALTLSGASGNITTGSSVTASAFFGSGAGLTDVSAVSLSGSPTFSTVTLTGNAFSVGGSTLVVAGGNIGIGTSGPESRLDIYGGKIYFSSNTTAANVELGGMVATSYNTHNPNLTAAEVLLLTDVQGWLGALSFRTNGSDVTATRAVERMRIDAFGKVGIGTTGPAAKLHMSSGTLLVDGDDGAGIPFKIGVSTFIISGGKIGIGTSVPGSPVDIFAGKIYFSSNTTDAGVELGGIVGESYNSHNPATTAAEVMLLTDVAGGHLGAISFRTNSSDATNSRASERMRIDKLGNVGIGTTNPMKPLDVNGQANFASSVTIGGSLTIGGYSVITSSIAAALTSTQTFSGQNTFSNTTSTQVIARGFSAHLGANASAGLVTLGNPAGLSSRLDFDTGQLRIENLAAGDGSNIRFGVTPGAATVYPLIITAATNGTSHVQLRSSVSTAARVSGFSAYGGANANNGLLVFGDNDSAGSRIDGGGGSDTNLRIDNMGDGSIIFHTNVSVSPATPLSMNKTSLSIFGSTLTVLASGNVGIGTSAPTSKLSFGVSVDNVAMDTLDGSDNKILQISGGGIAGTTRGGYINLHGNEYAGSGGTIDLASGINGKIRMYTDQGGGSIEKLVILNSGNIGIGTTSPATKLHMSSGTLTIDGNVATSLTTTGNVGIGYASPTVKLVVSDGGTPWNNVQMQNSTVLEIFHNVAASSVAISLGTPSNLMLLNYLTGANERFEINLGLTAVPQMVILNGGNVGIGTTGPEAKLEIAGSLKVGAVAWPSIIGNESGRVLISGTGGNPLLLLHDDTAVAANTGPGGIYFTGRTNDTGPVYAPLALILGLKENAAQGNTAGYLSFKTSVNGSNPDEKLRITSSGKVGIGTTAPAGKLHVSSGVVVIDGSGGALQFPDGTQQITAAASQYSFIGVSSGAGTGVSSLSFTGLSSSTSYKGEFHILQLGSGGIPGIRFNNESGATYGYSVINYRSVSGADNNSATTGTSCRLIGGNTVAAGESARFTFDFRTVEGNPKRVRMTGTLSYDDASSIGSGGVFICDYTSASNITELDFLTSAGTFQYTVKLYKSNW